MFVYRDVVRSLLFLLTALLAGGCTQSVDREAERQRLLQIDREWSQAASGGDMEKLLAFWDEDAVIYPAGASAVVGKQAIREFVMANRDIPGFSISWEPAEAVLSQSGDMAYTLGRGQINVSGPDGSPIVNETRYVVVWRRQDDGSWKCVVDMFNFDRPPRGAAPPDSASQN